MKIYNVGPGQATEAMFSRVMDALNGASWLVAWASREAYIVIAYPTDDKRVCFQRVQLFDDRSYVISADVGLRYPVKSNVGPSNDLFSAFAFKGLTEAYGFGVVAILTKLNELYREAATPGDIAVEAPSVNPKVTDLGSCPLTASDLDWLQERNPGATHVYSNQAHDGLYARGYTVVVSSKDEVVTTYSYPYGSIRGTKGFTRFLPGYLREDGDSHTFCGLTRELHSVITKDLAGLISGFSPSLPVVAPPVDWCLTTFLPHYINAGGVKLSSCDIDWIAQGMSKPRMYYSQIDTLQGLRGVAAVIDLVAIWPRIKVIQHPDRWLQRSVGVWESIASYIRDPNADVTGSAADNVRKAVRKDFSYLA
jgi:hypothetical protein